MFNKTELKIMAWSEKNKVYIAKLLTCLHVKYEVIGEERSITEYNMRVNRKQLCTIAKYVAPMFNASVQMRLYDSGYTYLKTPIRG